MVDNSDAAAAHIEAGDGRPQEHGTFPARLHDRKLWPASSLRRCGPDKFLGDDLDQRLKAHGIKTVILCGTSAQGVGLGTGAPAAQRGYYVIYPVDCLLSESAFREAYAAWHMGGGGPPVTTKWVTVTRSDMITFENANR